MSEQQGDGAAERPRPTRDEVEDPIALEAPERGSADELMDHGAAGELGPMRHSAAHVLAEAVLDLFPGTKLGIGPVIDDGFYYDFQLPRPLTPDDLPADRGADAREHRRRPPVRAERAVAGRGARVRGRARPAVQGRDHRRPARRGGARRHGDAADHLLPPGPVHRPVPRPARREHRQDRPVQAARHVAGAYWRGDEKRPMLQRVYGTAWATQEELDQYLWRREEAKKRDHRRLGVQLDLFSFHDVSPGSAFWHPKGQAHLAHPRRGDARAPGAARLPGGQHADRRLGAAVAPVGPLGPLQGEHVHRRVREPAVQPQADELPGIDVHLPVAPAVVPRPAAAASASTAGSIATSGPAR